MQEKMVHEVELALEDSTDTQTVEIDLNAQIQELTEENEMLFEQLHLVQEELEKYYYKLKDAEKLASQKGGFVADPNLHAENIRLTALVKAYKSVRRAEMHSTLQARIGDSIIKLSKALFAAPFKLLPTLLFFTKTTPPAAFGGKEFIIVIKAYEDGNIEAVKKLVQGVNTNSVIRANAYTAVAKHLQRRDLPACVEFARLAYITDPRDYRLKWWILRLNDMDNVITAAALLELLPADTKMNDAEKRKIERVRQSAAHYHKEKAGQEVKKANAPASAELQKKLDETQKKLSETQKKADENKSSLDARTKELSAVKTQLEVTNTQLEIEKTELTSTKNMLLQEQAQKAQLQREKDILDGRCQELREHVKTKDELLLEKEKKEQEYKTLHEANQIKENELLEIIKSKEASEGILLAQLSKKTLDANIDEMIDDIQPFLYKKSTTYVDIGAYVGEVYIKLKESKKINIREAHLFEPNPESYKKLLENIQKHSSASLHTYDVAIGSEAKKATFSSAQSMTKEVTTHTSIGDTSNFFEVMMHPFENFRLTITEEHIHFLKIDVEGNEMSVLESMKLFLEAQQIDFIYLEVGFNSKGKQQTYFCNIDIFLQKHNYRVFKVYEQKNEWIEDLPYMRRANFLYISKKFANANPAKITFENFKLRKELEKLKEVM